MKASALDDLARRLAQPVSRRRALRLVGAAALAATVPGLRPGRARATPPECAAVCRDSGLSIKCQANLSTCTPFVCCGGSEPVCCAGPASATCCKPGCSCKDDGRGFKSCQDCPRCDPGWTECGKSGCCAPGKTCAGSSSLCCDEGRAPCGTRCCDPLDRCANKAKGLCERCEKGREVCGSKCCPKDKFCCDARKGVCCKNKGGSCCPTGAGVGDARARTCCNRPKRCSALADESGFIPKGSSTFVCCPPDRLANPKKSSTTCCPPGYKGLGKFISRPGTSGGQCCRAKSVCGKGASINCCIPPDNALGPEFAEVCCAGKCASFKRDPRNCGACGKVCASGVCVDGACA